MKKDNNKEAVGPAKKTARAPRSTSTPAVEESTKQEGPKAGEKYMVRFTKPGQRAALMREAEKNFRSMNDEVLFRVFGEPVVFIRVTEADIKKERSTETSTSYMVRFLRPGQRAALMRECERSGRSVNGEILFRVFGELVTPIDVTEADIHKESKDG